ncbi:DUF885 domain-containing protein [Citricoccus sp. NR2]|uniref:DUF885 domain-containing protein n=1 Tax=Citricoccus sp. NR2 TaxID=3004095 RepID=UPI0022DD3B23|nr:DUF885 domain-containing protein [Citricoccus sp. NR2]WBL18866.1 DUF885 domain-containing protein [Citricoccus sp. NR2]
MTENHTEAQHGSASPRPLSDIDHRANRYFADLLELDPVAATELGRPGHETEYPDYSPAGTEAVDRVNAELLADLDLITPVDSVDLVTLAALRERVGLAREIHATGRTELNNIASPAQGIRMVFDMMPDETEEHWQHLAGRLANLPSALVGYQESLRSSARQGQIAAVRQVDIVIEQSEAHGADGGFFPTLVQRAAANSNVNEALCAEVEKHAEAAAQAYRDFAEFLRAELRPEAPTEDAVGIEAYRLASRDFLGATVDLEDTYAWGIEELSRIVAEQEQVAQQISPGATIEEAKKLLNEDPARQLHGTEALREWMQQRSDEALAAMKQYFEIPAEIDRIECMIAPTQEGGIYYTGPSEDFSRPGRMWWSVPAGEDSFTTWAETTTVYHEGVPGHHLQVGTSMTAADELNDWRRTGCWTSGHGEGWALYAERLMDEFGYLSDAGDRLGMLDMQRMRAARVVFDIGVHCGFTPPEEVGEAHWTPENGYAFLSRHLDISEGQRKFEFTRYLGWPGQAPSYKVGQRIWEQIRAEHQQRAEQNGVEFDLKAFHTRALRLGSMGLDTLREALA